MDMLTLSITILIFLSVYTAVYSLYLYRQMHVSLVLPESADISAKPKARFIENTLHKLLKPFGFLANFKLSRSFAGRSIPAKLIMAGSPISIVEFILFKILSLAFFPFTAYIIFQSKDVIYIILPVLVGFIAPDMWLNAKIKRRHREIRRDLPAVIDLLKLCVEAGLDFMLAVHKVIKEFKKCPLTDELSEVWKETRMGSSRRDALQHLSRRVNLLELSSFVRTLLQADRMGSPMGDALKIQSEEILQRRFFQGEEAALKAPIKLLLPLFLFILPAVLIIVAGPILLQFMRGGMMKF
ncbi:MAG: hypothetical protein A2321_02860 [Omnitrophica WOR_2 bacterium RIFOXYB2_FULL_45_11]|nr:MAG: hypothetical protein A2321_02860 [Omnitrophica WOR_2 bacterium RIFOXYB2_FULL_45_11]